MINSLFKKQLELPILPCFEAPGPLSLPGAVPAWSRPCLEMSLPGAVPAWRCPCLEMSLPGDVHAWSCPCLELSLPGAVPASLGQNWRCIPCCCVRSAAQSCPTLLQPARLLCPWGSPGKSTGVCGHFPPSGDLPNPGIEPTSPVSSALQVDFFTH